MRKHGGPARIRQALVRKTLAELRLAAVCLRKLKNGEYSPRCPCGDPEIHVHELVE